MKKGSGIGNFIVILSGLLVGVWATGVRAEAPVSENGQAEGSVIFKQVPTGETEVTGDIIGGESEEGSATSSSTAVGPTITPQPANTCYSFTTIDQGLISHFGYYCGAPLGTNTPDPSNTRPPCYARVAQPRFEAVIRDECAWIDFWTQHTSGTFPPPPVPDVDFNRHTVIVVISGPRPDGCYGIQIPAVVSTSCGTKVLVREIVPCYGQGCPAVVSNPYHIIKICNQFVPYDRPLCFEHRFMNPNCIAIAFCPDITPGSVDDGD